LCYQDLRFGFFGIVPVLSFYLDFVADMTPFIPAEASTKIKATAAKEAAANTETA
jgi:hypothetical protein